MRDENNKWAIKYKKLLDKFDYRVASMYYVTRDFIKDVAAERFPHFFNKFGVDYDDDSDIEKQEKDLDVLRRNMDTVQGINKNRQISIFGHSRLNLGGGF